MQRIGSRAQVMHGNAKMTGGGLMKKDLTYNKAGKIVSKKMSKMAKKEMRLQKAGYITTKGVFGVKKMSGGFKEVSSFDFKTIEKGIYLLIKDDINILLNIISIDGDDITYKLGEVEFVTKTKQEFNDYIKENYSDYILKSKEEIESNVNTAKRQVTELSSFENLQKKNMNAMYKNFMTNPGNGGRNNNNNYNY